MSDMANAKGKAKGQAVAKPRREDIPAEIKRVVRQRCGFGCVMCGVPIYDYEHMVDYAKVRTHEVKNITLLCPNHHRAKTNHLLPTSKLIEANANPFNLTRVSTAPYNFQFDGREPKVILGSVEFRAWSANFAAVIIDGTPIIGFRFENGHALLNLRAYDDANQLVLQVVDSEMIHMVDFWDFEFVGSTLTVRPRNKEILLQVQFLPEANTVNVQRGTLQFNRVDIDIWPDVVAILNAKLMISGLAFESQVGWVIGTNPNREFRTLPLLEIPEEGLVREFDRVAARKEIAAQRKADKAERDADKSARSGSSVP